MPVILSWGMGGLYGGWARHRSNAAQLGCEGETPDHESVDPTDYALVKSASLGRRVHRNAHGTGRFCRRWELLRSVAYYNGSRIDRRIHVVAVLVTNARRADPAARLADYPRPPLVTSSDTWQPWLTRRLGSVPARRSQFEFDKIKERLTWAGKTRVLEPQRCRVVRVTLDAHHRPEIDVRTDFAQPTEAPADDIE